MGSLEKILNSIDKNSSIYKDLNKYYTELKTIANTQKNLENTITKNNNLIKTETARKNELEKKSSNILAQAKQK